VRERSVNEILYHMVVNSAVFWDQTPRSLKVDNNVANKKLPQLQGRRDSIPSKCYYRPTSLYGVIIQKATTQNFNAIKIRKKYII